MKTEKKNIETIQKARKFLGVNRKELASSLGISYSYMYKILSGKRKIPENLIIEVAKKVEREIESKLDVV